MIRWLPWVRAWCPGGGTIASRRSSSWRSDSNSVWMCASRLIADTTPGAGAGGGAANPAPQVEGVVKNRGAWPGTAPDGATLTSPKLCGPRGLPALLVPTVAAALSKSDPVGPPFTAGALRVHIALAISLSASLV